MVFKSDDNKKPFPEVDIKNISESVKSIDKYYNEEFGLKPEMVNTFTRFKIDVLNESPLPNRAVIGKDGWYFLGNHSRNLLDDSFGNNSFSKSELENFKDVIKTIKDTLESKGIAFHIVVPPNKHRMYSEKLPYQLSQQTTRLEELNSFLLKEIDFEILDLRDTLITEKKKELLYYKTNTHWNDIGAYIGYRKTLNRLDLDVPIDSITNYNFENKPIKRGDVTELIHLKTQENAIFFNSKSERDYIELVKNKRHVLHFKNPNRNKKIILYRDSFANFWIKHFNQSFGETIYFRGYNINYKYLFNQKPDVVVIEVVERNLSHILLKLKKGLQNLKTL